MKNEDREEVAFNRGTQFCVRAGSTLIYIYILVKTKGVRPREEVIDQN